MVFLDEAGCYCGGQNDSLKEDFYGIYEAGMPEEAMRR